VRAFRRNTFQWFLRASVEPEGTGSALVGTVGPSRAAVLIPRAFFGLLVLCSLGTVARGAPQALGSVAVLGGSPPWSPSSATGRRGRGTPTSSGRSPTRSTGRRGGRKAADGLGCGRVGARNIAVSRKEDEMPRLEEGAKAPAFTLPDAHGAKVSLKDFAGRKVVVYFYPRDDTPGCTKEACQFNDNLLAFDRADVTVLGISPDGAEAHARFAAKYHLTFPLLSDPSHAVMEKYGAWGEKTLYGKKSLGVIRSTFLLDERGKVLRAWYSVKADGHAAKVLEAAAAAS
jgi:peroxiredoxin Q/BCP